VTVNSTEKNPKRFLFHFPQRSTDTGKRTTAHSKDLTTHTAHSVAISSSVHDLSPTLWHALDVWRCTNHLSGGLTEALKALSHCGMGLVNESWYENIFSFTMKFIVSSLNKVNKVKN
jgi:hypothetical protein